MCKSSLSLFHVDSQRDDTVARSFHGGFHTDRKQLCSASSRDSCISFDHKHMLSSSLFSLLSSITLSSLSLLSPLYPFSSLSLAFLSYSTFLLLSLPLFLSLDYRSASRAINPAAGAWLITKLASSLGCGGLVQPYSAASWAKVTKYIHFISLTIHSSLWL